MSKAAIDRCPQLQFKCPKRWSALAPTREAKVRHCTECNRNVHFCATIKELRERGVRGECVAFDPALRHAEAARAYDEALDPSRYDVMRDRRIS